MPKGKKFSRGDFFLGVGFFSWGDFYWGFLPRGRWGNFYYAPSHKYMHVKQGLMKQQLPLSLQYCFRKTLGNWLSEEKLDFYFIIPDNLIYNV
jgi:hypothetical protein